MIDTEIKVELSSLEDLARFGLESLRKEMQEIITALESRIANLENPQVDTSSVFVTTWDPIMDYVKDDIVVHEGKGYRALQDVAKGIPPDDVWDPEAQTGGWAPLGE
jgi:hypothetical protein